MNAPMFNPEMLLVIIASIEGKYKSLDAIINKHQLTLFTVLSPSSITRIENEISGNPNIMNEAVSFMEFCDVLSSFHGTESFYSFIFDRIASRRVLEIDGQFQNKAQSINANVMEEYFTDASLPTFLQCNPIFVGLYMYLFVLTASGNG